MRREFYYQDDRSNKFWTIERVGRTCVTTHGRIDAKPRETRKEFEAILSVAASAYQRKTGQEFEHLTPLSYETYSNRSGWPS